MGRLMHKQYEAENRKQEDREDALNKRYYLKDIEEKKKEETQLQALSIRVRNQTHKET